MRCEAATPRCFSLQPLATFVWRPPGSSPSKHEAQPLNTVIPARALRSAETHLGADPAHSPEKSGTGLERVHGIEPRYIAWKASALPLCYTRLSPGLPWCPPFI